jgi:hypothetical protein
LHVLGEDLDLLGGKWGKALEFSGGGEGCW